MEAAVLVLLRQREFQVQFVLQEIEKFVRFRRQRLLYQWLRLRPFPCLRMRHN